MLESFRKQNMLGVVLVIVCNNLDKAWDWSLDLGRFMIDR